MNTLAVRSSELFDSGYFCAESILMAVAEYLGVESELIPGLATGFCGGMARNNGLCGLLTGGIMALGLVHGRRNARESQAAVYEKVSRYIQEFEKQLGARDCTGLLGCDISTVEGAEMFSSQELESRVCARITGIAAGILMPLIESEDKQLATR